MFLERELTEKYKEKLRRMSFVYIFPKFGLVFKHGKINSGKVYFVAKAQTMLLNYAVDNGDFERKASVEFQRGNVYSAIFDMEQLLKKEGNSNNVMFKEKLASYYFERCKREKEYFQHLSSEDVFEDTLDRLEELPDSSSKKWEIHYKIFENEMSQFSTKHLENLVKIRMEFEEAFKLYEISQNDQSKKPDIIDYFAKMSCEVKTILDSSMNEIKLKVFQKQDDEKPYSYFPYLANGEDEMKTTLEDKYKLVDFKEKLPNVFEYLISKRPHWIENCCRVRNKTTHAVPEVRQSVIQHFPKEEERINFIREASVFAGQTWIFFEREIKTYLGNNGF